MALTVQKLAAFSRQGKGGNPAGVVLCTELPSDSQMLRIASDVGYSETAFLMPIGDLWRIRYFSPEMEVPFCGHATIASGAALGELHGPGEYGLVLNQGEITVSASETRSGVYLATLVSPATQSAPADGALLNELLSAFSFGEEDLDSRIPPARASAGADFIVLALKDREKLREMTYDFSALQRICRREEIITVNMIWIESTSILHARNAFAYGGVVEDPATGAAASALAGYLRDIHWPGNGSFEVYQGEDMGCPSRLFVTYTGTPGEGVQVSGETRKILDEEL